MRVYVAGRIRYIRQVRAAQAAVLSAGHKLTFDWTGPEGETRHDWSEAPQKARRLSERERQAVLTSHVVVLVGHGCEEGGGGLGCFIEVGIALATGISVIVYGPARESVFWYMPNVTRCETIEELELALAEKHASMEPDPWPTSSA